MITILKGDEAMHSMACAVGHVCWHYKWMVWWLLELLISQETGLVCDEKGLLYQLCQQFERDSPSPTSHFINKSHVMP